jgi:hypothetical protein
MMPVRQNEKTAKEVAKHFGVSNALSATTWRRNGHLRSLEQTTGAIWPTMRAQGKSWAEIASGGWGQRMVCSVLVRRYRTSLAESTGSASSPTFLAGRGL